jgi:hypothetical protein
MKLGGPGYFRYIAGTSRQLHSIYTKLYPTKVTDVIESVAQAELALQEAPEADQTTLCPMAARGGSVEALQFLRIDRNCSWDASTCAAAAERGHLSVLKWL